MTQARPLHEIKKIKVEDIVTKLKSTNDTESKHAGVQLAKDAASFGLSIKDYLKLAIPKEAGADGLNGYEQALFALDLPVRNDFDNGVYLQAATDTFSTYAGTRALFPEVIDDVLRFASRQDQVEQVAPMLAASRTINGVELLSTVVDAEADTDTNGTFSVSELGRIPVRTIKTSQTSVKIWKHGSALRTSYEFARRASIDLLKPHANRIARELERSKVAAATSVIINGDTVNGAASSVNQSSFNSATGATAVNGTICWQNFMYWLVQRAKAGVPIDTILMNWDGIFQWTMLFANPTTGASGTQFGPTAAEILRKSGVDIATSGQVISLLTAINPVVSSAVPANKLIGFTKGDTLEELKEAGSDIAETERAILNQSITLTKTENTGYKLVYGDTRQVYVFNA